MSPTAEKQVTFILTPYGRWDVQLYPAVDGKVFTIKIPIPAELLGETITASIEPKG
jgi:hypothetical protein